MIDFNEFELSAQKFIEDSDYSSAIRIFYIMADGDSSLDAGYLAQRIGFCYEMTGEMEASKYWYNRALEENPEVYDFLRGKVDVISKLISQ